MTELIRHQQRPIAHLLGQTVLVEAFLDNWRPEAERNDVGVVLTSVKITDYETGKQSLAPTLDHCWLWVPEGMWNNRVEMTLLTGEQMLLNDRVWLCCSVCRYIRRNGTMDHGLRIRNEFPVSIEQACELRKNSQSLSRRVKQLHGRELGEKLLSWEIYLKQLEMQTADWRELGHSWKDAKATTAYNVSLLWARFNGFPELKAKAWQIYSERDRVINHTQAQLGGDLI